MVLNNRENKGFTIVELLVVIVVIAILAAITIVAYTGVTAKANGSKALANAKAIASVAAAINADSSSRFPVTIAEFGSLASTARVPSNITLQVTAPTSSNGTTNFQLYTLTTNPSTGGKVVFWDYTKATPGVCTGASAGADTCMYWGAANNATNYNNTGMTVFAS